MEETLDEYIIKRVNHEMKILDEKRCDFTILRDTAYTLGLKDKTNQIEFEHLVQVANTRVEIQEEKIEKLIAQYTAEYNRLRLEELTNQ